jgi:GNAT superfamily N-acetyltransferase
MATALPWSMDEVRQARPADRATVTVAVAAAFAHDPAWTFLFGDDYDALAPLFAGVLFDRRVGSGDVWVAADGAAAALWEPPKDPGAPPDETDAVWGPFRHRAGDEVWERLTEYERAVDAARPTTPYWYLGVLATRPDRQGGGLATAVIAPVLARADTTGTDCCLETSTTANKAFYSRRGFTETTTVDIASGPPTWWLRRPARRLQT